MPHYIYALKDKEEFLYIGRTVHPDRRESNHRGRKDKKCGSVHIPKEIKWRFVIIDECETIEEAMWSEKLLIDFFEPPYNQVRPRVTGRDYTGIMNQPQQSVMRLPGASTPTRH